MKKIKKYLSILLLVVFIISMGFNVFLYSKFNEYREENRKFHDILVFKNANSRDTFYNIHNVDKAHKITKGAGIKVGIIDKFFGYNKHPKLYTDGKDFSKQPKSFSEIAEHGYWMALALKEVAPQVEIYALNYEWDNKKDKVKSMIEAMDWAIKNDLDVLTYSSSAFSGKNKQKLDTVVDKAIENNIVTTFIHYPYEKNIHPDGFFELKGESKADLNVFHYDYNSLNLERYYEFKKRNPETPLQKVPPFFSISSTSPVTAGFVALLKSYDNDLTPEQCKEILIKTSRELQYKGRSCTRVVDIHKALNYINEN